MTGPESSPRVIQLEVPDLDGGLRAKLVSAEKAQSAAGVAMCTIMFGLTQADDVYESPASSAASGSGAPDPATADASADERFGCLPATLADAVEAMRASPVAPGLLGGGFVAHYVLSREVELRLWREWEAEQVTEWEQRRYFETS